MDEDINNDEDDDENDNDDYNYDILLFSSSFFVVAVDI